MNWKLYLLILCIFMLVFLLVLGIGLHYKEKLMKETESINNLNNVITFIDDCNKKPFLDCNKILINDILPTA